ncbi:Hypothetical protein PHPALM_14275 [Phytophthora palmivora]|uniref:Uncharacterized protein n=1 Tax=Phytophthora palmivora TaxID=4796 RepID=A0A2P4XV57_9STRA|nr:Hypothetical protein PHPALM_14275 [Phytophthora palmivora]
MVLPIHTTTTSCPRFAGDEYLELLRSYGIKPKPITVKNPQANAICERVYLGPFNIIRCNENRNDKRIEHFYNPGDHVMLRVPKALRPKPKAVAYRPYTIRQVHDNGMATIEKGTTTQQVSIHRTFPC